MLAAITKSVFKGIYQYIKLQGKFFDQKGFMIFACSCKHPSSILLGKKQTDNSPKADLTYCWFFKLKRFKIIQICDIYKISKQQHKYSYK